MAEVTSESFSRGPNAAGRAAVSSRRVWLIFTLLFALMVIDHFDRQVIVPMFPYLKEPWALTDVELAALVSVVAIIVAVGTVPLSFMADRWGHVRSIVAMALLWSGATVACAYAPDYATLLVARGVVGVGEAAYGAVGAALVGTLFPGRMRGTMLGLFLAASVIGSMLGVALGGAIARPWGWQAPFAFAGIAGIVLAFLFLAAARGGPTGVQTLATTGARLTLSDGIRSMRRARTALVASLGGGLHLIGVSAAYAWLPSYFNRHYGIAPHEAGIWAGAIMLIGVVALPLWSAAADLLSPRVSRARLLVPAVASVSTAAFMMIAFGACDPGRIQLTFIVAGSAAMTGTLGAVAAAVIDVVHPAVRATATSVLTLSQNLIGMATGPLLAGFLSDRYGLSVALCVVPLACLAAAGLFLVGARTYLAEVDQVRRDTALADYGVAHGAA